MVPASDVVRLRDHGDGSTKGGAAGGYLGVRSHEFGQGLSASAWRSYGGQAVAVEELGGVFDLAAVGLSGEGVVAMGWSRVRSVCLEFSQ